MRFHVHFCFAIDWVTAGAAGHENPETTIAKQRPPYLPIDGTFMVLLMAESACWLELSKYVGFLHNF